MKNLNHYTRFRVKNSGDIVKYNNFTNGLYGDDLTPWTPEGPHMTAHEPSLKKSNKPSWLRILLGHACNYDCSYCMQKDIGNPNERAKITTTERFIQSVQEKLDLSEVQKIDLWGGETLLYWKTIMPIIEALDAPHFQWYIPTNGVPLRPKHVEFFNGLKARVGIGMSHDGPGHEQLRGKEFLHNISTVETIRMIEAADNIAMSFNVVISQQNYDLFEINKFFMDYIKQYNLNPNNFGITYEMGRAHYDPKNVLSGSYDHVLHGEKLTDFNNILRDYIEKCRQQQFEGADHGLLKNSMFHYGMGVLEYARTLKEQSLPNLVTKCGVDDEQVLSIDMAGNVRTCPHVDDSDLGGHILHLDEVELTGLDLDRYDSHCGKCPVFRLCKSTCPLKVPDRIFHANCRAEKVHYKAIQQGAMRILFNSEVEELNEDTE